MLSIDRHKISMKYYSQTIRMAQKHLDLSLGLLGSVL